MKGKKYSKDFIKRVNKLKDAITISQERYDELIKDSDFLNALRVAGVDNWDGYDFAIDILNENE